MVFLLTGCGRLRRLPDEELWLEAPAALCSEVAEFDFELSPPDLSSAASSLSPERGKKHCGFLFWKEKLARIRLVYHIALE